VVNERPVEDGNERFGEGLGERAEPGSQSRSEEKCFGDWRAHARGVAVSDFGFKTLCSRSLPHSGRIGLCA
jgi:hypothetical protein